MRINSKQSLYESFQSKLKESNYYYKEFSGAGEIDYIEFDDEWEAQNYAEKVNKETGHETAVYRMDNDECIAVFDAKEKTECVKPNKVDLKEVFKSSRCKLTEGTKAKRISHFGEFDNGHVFHKWYEMSDEEAENKAKQMSIEHPDDVWYVAYDDVMNPGSDKRWFRGKEYDPEKAYQIYCQVCRNGFNTKSPEEQKKIMTDLGLTESDEGHHTIPYDVQEVVENEVYEDRNLNIRGSQFRGSDFVVESRDEMNEDIFHKIVDRMIYHFDSYGISYDSIEDEGNNVVAYDCFMSDAAYNEYKANSDDYKVDDEDFYMLNNDTDEKVHVYKDGNKWYDTDGNRYMGYLTKDQVKAYFKGNWTELKESIEQKYNKSNPDYNRFLNDVKKYTGSYDYLFGGKVDTECYGYPITVKYFYYNRPYVGGGYNLVANVLTPMDSLAGDDIQEVIDNAFERNSKDKLSQKEIKEKILQAVSSLN